MTLVAPPTREDAVELPIEAQPHRFTLENYLRMSELGFFGERRVEFLDGEVIDMPAQRLPHVYSVSQATQWCHGAFESGRFLVSVQATLVTGSSSPEPDIAVIENPKAISGHYAVAERAVLVTEIADSTLLADTTIKMSLYAAAGVQEYWVASIPDRVLIVHRQPIQSKTAKHGFVYAEIKRFVPGQRVSPLAMPAASCDPAKLFD